VNLLIRVKRLEQLADIADINYQAYQKEMQETRRQHLEIEHLLLDKKNSTMFVKFGNRNTET